MAMKMFTNASPSFDGESIAINSDIVASVFELIQPAASAATIKRQASGNKFVQSFMPS
jgi:hypothetical protein